MFDDNAGFGDELGLFNGIFGVEEQVEGINKDSMVFEIPDRTRSAGWWLFLGGLGALLIAALSFVVALTGDGSQVMLHLTCTLPTIFGVGMIAQGWRMSRGIQRVAITGRTIELWMGGVSSSYEWPDVGSAVVSPTMMGSGKQCVLRNQQGKSIAVLSNGFPNFEDLTALIIERVKTQPVNADESQILRKARKAAVKTIAIALFLFVMSILLIWMTYDEQRTEALLKAQPTIGIAKIDRLFIAPNGVTKRAEYTVTNSAGETGSRNVELSPAVYDALEAAGATTIEVRFVDSEPDVSEPLLGEVITKDTLDGPLVRFALGGVLALISLFFIGAGIVQWNGKDIDMDSKTGKISIVKFGQGT